MDYFQVLSDLVSIDTSMPPGNNYEKTVDYLVPLFAAAGCETQKILVPREEAEGREGRFNLLCHRRKASKPRLIFYTHIDVVPAQGWPAFQPREEGGKIYGRGAADMKGAIPALLAALERCKERKLDYDISIMMTTDEEYSQASQLRYLSRFLEPLKGAWLFDLDSSFGFVSIAGLGALHLDIKVTGKSVHSGLSHMGENAVEKALRLMNALMELKARVTQRKSRIEASPACGLATMVPRLNINMVQGGLKVNIVPDQCVISVDRRLIPEENMEEARKEIIEALKAVPDVNWQIEKEVTIPCAAPCQDPVTDDLVGIIKEVTGQGGKYGEMGSGDLGNIVVNEWGGVEFGLGVIRPENNIHGINEFVYKKDIADLAEILFRFLTR
jgi:succinyl-diaminopimelate desuccinylase